MLFTHLLNQSESRSRYLLQLCWIRLLVLVLLGISIPVGRYSLQLDLPWAWLYSLVFALALLTAGSFYRARQPQSLGDRAYLANLLAEVALIALVMQATGGASNPFIFYFLVPVSVAAATLQPAFAWMLSSACALIYSLLMFFYRPLPLFSMHHEMAPHWQSPHVLGMWFNFVLSAFLITLFVSRMARLVRQRERELAEREQRQREDDNLVALGAFAAGTAHELATPLSTAGMLVEEVRDELSADSTQREELTTAASQIERCRESLRRLVETARLAADSEARQVSVPELLQQVVQQARNLFSGEPQIELQVAPEATNTSISVDPALQQGLLNLLINAVQASASGNSDRVFLQGELANHRLLLRIQDEGAGLNDELQKSLGRSFVSRREGGMGVGYYLANAAINRAGGSLAIMNREAGGAETLIQLPLAGDNP